MINGRYETELIKPSIPWRTLGKVEIAAVGWLSGSASDTRTFTSTRRHPTGRVRRCVRR